MAWTDAQQNPHDYLAPGAGVGYSGGISGQYPIGIGGGYAGALRLGGAPSASSVPTPLGRPAYPGSLIPLPSGRPGSGPGPFGAVGQAGPRGATNAAPVGVSQALAASAGKLSSSQEAAIRQEAARLGVAPSSLAAVMDYETMGRMSTDITNPYGYKGLIQFGPTEQKAYGYQPGQSFEQQLFGPVHNYLTDRGLPAGASLSTLYRTINGGNPAASLNSQDVNGTLAQHIDRISAGVLPKYAYLDNGYSGQGSTDTMYGGTMPNPNMRPGRTTDARGGPISPGQFLTAIGPQPRPMGPNDYLVPPGQNIDALTYTGEPAPSPTNAVFRLPNANTPPPVSPAATPSIAGGTPYVVKTGDTLWQIAADQLGNPNQWPTIAQANGIRRGQERNIQPGQQLLIPGGAPAAPPPMPNTTAQGLGPMPPVPTPQARPSITAPGIPDPRLRPGNQPGPFSTAVSRETAVPSTAGTGPDQFRFANAGLGQQTTRMGLQPGVLPQLPEPVGGRQPSAEDQYRLATSGSGNQTTNMSMQPYTLPQLPFPNLPTDTPWGNVPTRQQASLPSPPAGPGQDLTGYIPPVNRMEQALGNVPMALPTQPGGTQLPSPMPGPNLPGPTQALPITMDPNVAATIARTPAVISDREIRIITARTPPVYVAPDGSRIWQIR